MSDRHIWTDPDGDEIELTQYDDAGEIHDDKLWLVCTKDIKGEPGEALFEFTREDARSFARALMAFAEEGE